MASARRCWLAALALVACSTQSAAAPLQARQLPDEAVTTRELLDELGARLYSALRAGTLHGVLLGESELFTLVSAEAGRRIAAARSVRHAILPDPDARSLWSSARYAGLCVQQGRVEAVAGPLGLKASGFVFERALIEGREPGGGVLAGWVEGAFLLTSRGFFALAVERIEAPRRDHADLELAVCELRAGRRRDPSALAGDPASPRSDYNR